MNSLAARLLAAAGVVLLAFVALGGLALNQAVRERAVEGERDRMEGLAYAVLGKAQIGADGSFRLPARALPESNLGRPGSGTYALVTDGNGDVVWRSPSVIDPIETAKPPAVGEWRFARPDARGHGLLQLAFGIRWVTQSGNSHRYNLTIAQNPGPMEARLDRFRGVLWTWLIVAAAILLAVLLGVLRWGLAPLRRVSRKLDAIESGETERIDGEYPAELRPLVDSLNTMLAREKARLERYRNALADLAHSLKTPVAVLRGVSDSRELPDEQSRQLDSQLTRINEIVDYQLQRAATVGGRALAAPEPVRPVVERLTGALAKVYADAGVTFENNVPETLSAAVDSGDLTEILGNLLDNAAKYGRRRVRIGGERTGGLCVLTIDDDGDGFPENASEALMERGARADTRREGQGIGLAVTAEIVRAYEGDITLEAVPHDDGGSRVRLQLP